MGLCGWQHMDSAGEPGYSFPCPARKARVQHLLSSCTPHTQGHPVHRLCHTQTKVTLCSSCVLLIQAPCHAPLVPASGSPGRQQHHHCCGRQCCSAAWWWRRLELQLHSTHSAWPVCAGGDGRREACGRQPVLCQGGHVWVVTTWSEQLRSAALNSLEHHVTAGDTRSGCCCDA